MTTPSPKPTCPTCRRRPSERTDYVEIHDGNTGKFKYVKDKRCSDPIHDLADRLVAEHATPRASEADALREASFEAHAARAIAEDEASALRALLVRAREVINEHACEETVLLDDIDTALAARAQERES